MRSVYRTVLVLATLGLIAVGGVRPSSACDGLGKAGMPGQSAMANAMMANQMAKAMMLNQMAQNSFGQFGGGKGFANIGSFGGGKQGGGAKFAGQAGFKK